MSRSLRTTVQPLARAAVDPSLLSTAELRQALPLVTVRELSVAYDGGPTVLDGVDLDLFPGEMVALLGSSGSCCTPPVTA